MASTTKRMTKAETRAFFEDYLTAWNDHDIDAILAHVSDDVLWKHPGLIEPVRGKAALRADTEATFRSFPDWHMPIEDAEVFFGDDPNLVMGRSTFVATMDGPLVTGHEPTGKPARITMVAVYRLRGGLISEQTVIYDGLGFMQQLGLLPKPGDLTFKVMLEAQNLALRAKKALNR